MERAKTPGGDSGDRGAEPGGERGAAPDRREFIGTLSSAAMTVGLAGGYGTFAVMAARFLYPAGPTPRGWIFVVDIEQLATGDSFLFETPAGDRVLIARKGEGTDASNFVALSGVCPHLGCRVRWEPHNDRFFCPCHNGTFNRDGDPTGGPPADAGTPLLKYKLQVENGLILILAPLESLAKPTRLAMKGACGEKGLAAGDAALGDAATKAPGEEIA